MSSSWKTSWPTVHLTQTDVFKAAKVNNSVRSLPQASNSYLVAEAMWKSWDLTLMDIMTLSDKFWTMHMDPINCFDGAAMTLLTIHLNLAIGTIGTYASNRPDLLQLCQDMLDAKVLGQFCLTEVGHGLDATNLETTATLQKDGSFILHSPNRRASKYMPPTVPVLGKPCYAVVWSQLVVEGEKRGIRPFVVKINDGVYMSKGITSKLIPTRHGATPVNHAITHFTNVRLPSTALLGKIGTKPSTHEQFLTSIWRVAVGTLALTVICLPGMRIGAHIAYKYSIHRRVGAPNPVPILSFRTQQIPVFTAVAFPYVLEALQKYVIKNFMDPDSPFPLRHAFATIFKAVVTEHCQNSHYSLIERCGAQGLFEYNQLVSQLSEMRGMVIAEGDVLVLCIRLASELLLGRYEVPASTNSQSLLARHEIGVFAECRALAQKFGHRSQVFADYILPRSKELVEAVGHRMAYDAAVAEGVPQPLIDLYEHHVVSKDIGWYLENGLLTRARAADMLNAAIKAAEPKMEEWVDDMGVAAYVRAPILSDSAWDKFVDGMYTFGEAPELRLASL